VLFSYHFWKQSKSLRVDFQSHSKSSIICCLFANTYTYIYILSINLSIKLSILVCKNISLSVLPLASLAKLLLSFELLSMWSWTLQKVVNTQRLLHFLEFLPCSAHLLLLVVLNTREWTQLSYLGSPSTTSMQATSDSRMIPISAFQRFAFEGTISVTWPKTENFRNKCPIWSATLSLLK